MTTTTAEQTATRLANLGIRPTDCDVLEKIDTCTPDGGPEERRAVYAALVRLHDEVCPGCANRVSPMERLTGRCAKSGQSL